MDSTNVEEESSDAAAYGLVALCDQTYEGLSGQLSEEVVETSGPVVDDNSVKILIQSIADGDETGATFKVSENANDEINPSLSTDVIQFDPSAIAYVQEECVNRNELDVSSLQEAVAEAIQRAGIKVEEVTNESGEVFTSIEGIQVDQTDGDPERIDGNIEQVHNADGEVLVSYQVDVLDEHYIQTLKSRQALMREAVEWKVYARMLLEKGCSTGANFHEPEVLSVLKATDDVVLKAEILSRITEKDMLQPAVQFWDFKMVYEAYCINKSLNCPSCSMPLIHVPFGQRFALRMLYDLDRPILLVTSFLRCTNKGKKQHEILGYDPRLLRMFPNLDLPFMLFHKAGITKQMMEFILDSIINGITVNRLFDVIKTKYEVNHTITSQFFANEIETIRAHVLSEGGHIEISAQAMFPPYVNCHPSKALLGRCFLAAFKEKDEYYKLCMQQLLANECIVLDDSLSVGARIGLPGVWGSAMKMFPEEFQGMFLVLNESKHILSWTFLKENKFDDVEAVLVELRDRHVRANKSLKACFTTKCCAWKDNLRRVFGKWFIVKGNLRLFLDQIIKEIPVDHNYYQDCVNELTLVFRMPNDTDDIRKEYTADALVVSHNLQEFLKRWRDVIDDRIQAVLTGKAIELLVELEQHIKAGCLSGIPPEVGDDNFNEIHNTLRKSVSHCRITVPLVSALFSMCLHEINRSKGAPCDFQCKDDAIEDSDKTTENDAAALETGSESPRTSENTTTVGIQTEDDDQHSEGVPLIIDKQKYVSAADIINLVCGYHKIRATKMSTVLLQALMYYKYQEDFDAFAPQAIANLRLLPYYSSALNLISHPAFPKEEKSFDMKHISHGLLEMELKIRRLRVDVASSARLSGNLDDAFAIISRQLQKDKMSGNLSIDVLEYLKELLQIGVHLIDMKEKDIVASLKNLVDFEISHVENIKKELLGSVNKTLRTTSAKKDNSCSVSEIGDCENSGDDVNVDSVTSDITITTTTKTTTIATQTTEMEEAPLSTDDGGGDNALDFPMTDPLSTNESLDNRVKREEPIQSTNENDATPMVVDKTHIATTLDVGEMTAIDQAAVVDGDVYSTTNPSNEDFELLKKLADKLGAIITLFTQLEHCWVIPIFPEKFSVYAPHFFVIYRFQRFFPASLSSKSSVSSIRSINLKRQGREPQCRCGRGTPGKTGQGRCVTVENGKYLTRCICFRLDRGCGSLCDCRNCENPFGKRKERIRPKKTKIPYRQRYAHEAARIATCKGSSVSTTIATQTPTIPEVADVESDMESWVPLEHCIFEALINDIKSDDSAITPSEVQETFNKIVRQLSIVPQLSDVAYQKTIQQISMKLQQRERDVSEYLQIYQMQVDLSLG